MTRLFEVAVTVYYRVNTSSPSAAVDYVDALMAHSTHIDYVIGETREIPADDDTADTLWADR